MTRPVTRRIRQTWRCVPLLPLAALIAVAGLIAAFSMEWWLP